MTLHLTIVGALPAVGGSLQYDVAGPDGLSGRALAAALDAGTTRDLFVRETPLSEVADLPESGHLLLTPFPRGEAIPAGPPPVWLAVAEGPDAGQTVPLPRGTYSIGRGACDIRIMDPALSRHHADLVVDATSITLTCTEGNAALRSDRRVSRLRLTNADRFILGRTTLHVSAGGGAQRPPERWPLDLTPVGRPPGNGRPWLMLLGAVLPLIVGIGLVTATASWYFLAFSGLGLFTGGIPALSELRSRRAYALRVREAEDAYLHRLERVAPPPGDRALAALHTRGGQARTTGPAAAFPLRIGRGGVRPPLGAGQSDDPPGRVAAPNGPVVVDMHAGAHGAITGSPVAGAGVLRAIAAQLALNSSEGGWETWVQGPTTALPSELRRVRGVRVVVSPNHLLSLRRDLPVAATLVLSTTDAAWLDACSASIDGSPLPAIVCLDPSDTVQAAAWRLSLGDGRLSEGSSRRQVDPDRVGFKTLAALAGRLADDCGAGMSAAADVAPPVLPTTVPLAFPARGWHSSAASDLRTVLGMDHRGEVALDLVGDGPHMLIAGTTGAGKSELVKSLVLGLACAYSPSELALMLVDFKGGATLGPFRDLPHCHAFVSDLNVETADRTLESLRTEITRRERLLGHAGAADYAQFRALAPPGREPLPRLVVVVDEFRVLTDELPEALGELMRIASVGRSLGIHLVLATQRPQGVVSAEMRANINTILCLRLMSAFDSNDLLGSPVAAEIRPDLPGRAYLRRGGGPPSLFHAASILHRKSGWTVTPVATELGAYGPHIRIDAEDAGPVTPMDIVGRIADATDEPGWPAPLFSPPLPDELSRLPRRLRTGTATPGVVLGVLDDVGRQELQPLVWNPRRHRRLAVISGPAGGAHAAAACLVAGAARGTRECHVYIADGARLLGGAADIPRVGAYVDPDEPERVVEILDLLERPVGEASDRLLVVTGLAVWQSSMGGAAFAQFDDRLAALARDAARRGVAIVVVGDRDLTSSRFFSLAEHRLYCPFGLGPETVLGWPKLRRVHAVPGRGVLVGPDIPAPGMALQLLSPDESPFTSGFPPAGSAILRSISLPSHLSRRELDLLPGGTRPVSRRDGWLVGVTGPDNRPWFWQPGSVGLILGGSGSGKTTALLHIASQAEGPVVALGFTEGALPGGPASPFVGLRDGTETPALVVVDAATDLPESERVRVEAWHARGAQVLMGATPSSRLYSALPLAGPAREAGSAILLNPRAASDADFLGWRIQPLERDVPGRGLALVDGALKAVQCAADGA